MGLEWSNERATDPLALMVDLNPTKALTVTLAIAIGSREDSAHPSAAEQPSPGTRAYLQQLQKWGYTLSAIEERAVDLATTDPTEEEGE
ncbi:hypothetical protein [Pseudoclavibacter sp. AY1H1]|uniref:hypothetical protein n=1 Tax=Pseudoclavibacter sp. AY1H1 TaxID=2080584 RepID=UPI000CE76B54|nr:hypothetical protein [Pseudoclavibacter sp. AY1H1]PPF39804.1 hypothetical protein C5E05_00890 [Pseudoclavibacter sp. AY1H1]